MAGQLQPLEAAPAEVGLPVGQVRVAGLDRGHAAANHESVFPLRRPIGGQYSPGGAGAGAGLLGGGDLCGLQHRAPPVVGVAGVAGGPHSAAVPAPHTVIIILYTKYCEAQQAKGKGSGKDQDRLGYIQTYS